MNAIPGLSKPPPRRVYRLTAEESAVIENFRRQLRLNSLRDAYRRELTHANLRAQGPGMSLTGLYRRLNSLGKGRFLRDEIEQYLEDLILAGQARREFRGSHRRYWRA